MTNISEMGRWESLRAYREENCDKLKEECENKTILEFLGDESSIMRMSELDYEQQIQGAGVEVNLDICDRLNALVKEQNKGYDKSKFDRESGKLLFDGIRILEGERSTKRQLTDHRIWWGMVLHHLPDWVVFRFPDSPAQRLILNPTAGNIFRHPLARLWWTADLLYDKDTDSPWRLFDIMVSSQDVWTAFMDRASLCSNKRLLSAAMSFLAEDENKKLLEGKTVKIFAKWLIAYSDINDFLFIDEEQMTAFFKKAKKQALRNRN